MSSNPHAHTLVFEAAEGGDVAARLDGPKAAAGRIPAAIVSSLHEAFAALPRRASPLRNHPGKAGQWDRAEDAFGEQMGRALGSAGEVLPTLLEALAAAGRQGARPLVLLDPRTSALRSLPWELLRLGDPPVRLWTIATLGRIGRSGHSPTVQAGPRLRHLLFAPQVGDPVIEAVHAQVGEGAARAGEPVVEVGLGAWPVPPLPSVDVLHVAAHGVRTDGELVVQLAGDRPPVSVIAFAEALAAVARPCALIVLWSCHGAGWDDEALETAAGRLLALGVPTVLAPAVEIPGDWAQPWLEAFHDGMKHHATVRQAATQARAALAVLQRADWRCRTHHLRLFVGQGSVDQDPRLYWLPERWPAVSTEVAELLTGAWEEARRRGSDFVGVEHLMLALLASPRPEARSAVALDPLLPSAEELVQRLTSWSQRGPSSPLLATSRLRAWGERLRPGMGWADWWEEVGAELMLTLARQLPSTPYGTLTTHRGGSTTGGSGLDPTPLDLAPPTGFEVVGGPEDGRELRPTTGQFIGRYDPDGSVVADIALYAETAAWDMQLSRRHLRWLGAGRVHLRQRGYWIHRMGGTMPLPEGERPLLVGDLVQLSRGTALRALP